MKVTAASAALALLPAGALADALEKRALQCSTVYGVGQAKVAGNVRLATQTKTVGGRTVQKTVMTKHTVYVTPTVSRTLTGTTVITDSVTATRTGKPTTVTVTGSSTSTVPAQPGFTAAQAAVPKANTNAKAKAKAKGHHGKGKHHGTKVHEPHSGATKVHETHSGKAKIVKATKTGKGARTKTKTKTGSGKATATKHAAGGSHKSFHHTKREAEVETGAPVASPVAPQMANARVPLSVVCTKSAPGMVTETQTVAQKPYATKYAKAQTVTVNRQRTRKVERVVATTTIHQSAVVEVPRATHWAACQDDNLLGWTWGRGGNGVGSNSTANGGNGTSASAEVGISSVILVSGTTSSSFDTSTAAQCCIRCQTTSGCVGSQWRSGVCNIHVRPAQFGACSANQAIFTLGSFFANPLSFLDPEEGYILSNGRCGGTWKFGGLTI